MILNPPLNPAVIDQSKEDSPLEDEEQLTSLFYIFLLFVVCIFCYNIFSNKSFASQTRQAVEEEVLPSEKNLKTKEKQSKNSALKKETFPSVNIFLYFQKDKFSQEDWKPMCTKVNNAIKNIYNEIKKSSQNCREKFILKINNKVFDENTSLSENDFQGFDEEQVKNFVKIYCEEILDDGTLMLWKKTNTLNFFWIDIFGGDKKNIYQNMMPYFAYEKYRSEEFLFNKINKEKNQTQTEENKNENLMNIFFTQKDLKNIGQQKLEESNKKMLRTYQARMEGVYDLFRNDSFKKTFSEEDKKLFDLGDLSINWKDEGFDLNKESKIVLSSFLQYLEDDTLYEYIKNFGSIYCGKNKPKTNNQQTAGS